jgi:hypothetical protein
MGVTHNSAILHGAFHAMFFFCLIYVMNSLGGDIVNYFKINILENNQEKKPPIMNEQHDLETHNYYSEEH